MATITTAEPALDEYQNERYYEVVKGRRVKLPPMSVLANRIRNRLAVRLTVFAAESGLGEADSEMLFLIDEDEDNRRRPDASFLSYERSPRGQGINSDAAFRVVPDLAVEVVSPTDRGEELLAKIAEYLDAGVRAVWLVYPVLRVVHVFHSFTNIQVVTREGHIDGGEVLPGFRLSMATLFEGLGG